MTYPIKQWGDIKDRYEGGSIILGNGASIAIHDRFHYRSLREMAEETAAMPPELASIFTFFNTDDFEFVLRMLWFTSRVNSALGVAPGKADDAYQRVRDGLIRAVRESHPDPASVAVEVEAVANYLMDFELVLSLNYDLIVYWAMMTGNRYNQEHKFKDCFLSGSFDHDWKRYYEPIGRERSCTVVCYPHGNLALARDVYGRESKVSAGEDSQLRDAILEKWEAGDAIPLFVSEGGASQKRRSIDGSDYLRTVLHEITPSVERSLVIYGWGMSEQDAHVIEKLDCSKIERIAVSVYRGDQTHCAHVMDQLDRAFQYGVEIEFFEAESPGCWVYPEDET